MGALDGIKVVKCSDLSALHEADLVLSREGQTLRVAKNRYGRSRRLIGEREIEAFIQAHGRDKIVIREP
jgi:hypothetical protein